MDIVYSVFLLLGGIGLFLYGINFLSASLKELAGNKMRDVLEKATGNGLLAVLTGVLVTMLIQSSGATSVMVVNFVNAGMMELVQAINIMLGANIGTTITAQIIAFKIDNIAPLILFIGLVMVMFLKNKTVKKAGNVVLSFGILFVGIYLMGIAVKALPVQDIIESFVSDYSNPVLCVLFGVIVTAIIQSSSASIGILQVIAAAAGASAVCLSDLAFIILGMNIGAASPVVIAALAGKRSAKRTALANVLSKVIGVIVVALIMIIVPNYAQLIEKISPDDVARQIANFHLMFNIISTVVVFPLVKPLAKLIYKIIPNTEDEDLSKQKLIYISYESLLAPSIAVSQAKKEIGRMGAMAESNLNKALDAFFTGNTAEADYIEDTEKTINFLNHEITAFLVQLHGKSLSESDLEQVGMMLRVVSDIERLGDHAENILEYALMESSDLAMISSDAMDELKTIAERSTKCVNMSLDAYLNNKKDMLSEISAIEEEVDDLQEKLVENHIVRLKASNCDPRGGVIFTDLITDLERCSDHAINIAFAINGEKTTVQMKKSYVIARGSENV